MFDRMKYMVLTKHMINQFYIHLNFQFFLTDAAQLTMQISANFHFQRIVREKMATPISFKSIRDIMASC